MASITLKGNTIHTVGALPEIGSTAPDAVLVKTDLSKVSISDYRGQRVLLNVFPSIDTGTCAMSVRKFNEQAAGLENTVVLCVSRDLPFAQKRFCGAEGIEKAVAVSDFGTGAFGAHYGLTIKDGPMEHLHSRSVIVLDEEGKVIYTEQVSEITDEPNYEKAINALK